jgi:hypothetical protein
MDEHVFLAMPVILKKNIDDQTTIGIWQIDEEESFFLDKISLSASETLQLQQIKGKRRLHWLCSRYLLHLLTKEDLRLNCLKDQYGKPYLEGLDKHISFSHSDDLVAVALSNVHVGIDIQKAVEKIVRIRHKFINSHEDSYVDVDQLPRLHIIWGAKESVFKAYGRKEVDFKGHMTFDEIGEQKIRVVMKKPNEGPFLYRGKYEQWGEYYLVYLKQELTND